MFLNADASRCALTSGSVAVDLRYPSGQRLVRRPIYFVQGDSVSTWGFHNASLEWAQFKTFELGLDYRRTMERVQLQVIPKLGLALAEWHEEIRSYLRSWWAFLKRHKQQQFSISDETQWPSNLPWTVNSYWDMPVVIWLTKKQLDWAVYVVICFVQ